MHSHILLIALFSVGLFCNDVSANEPPVIVETKPVSCNNGTDGAIIVKIPDTKQYYTSRIYQYEPQGKVLESDVLGDTTLFQASNLAAGKYLVEINGDGGFSYTGDITVSEPDKLKAEKIEILKKLSSSKATDAILKAKQTGGVPPYIYVWNNETDYGSQLLENIGQGIYSCVIDDANKCGPVKITIIFNEQVFPDIIED